MFKVNTSGYTKDDSTDQYEELPVVKKSFVPTEEQLETKVIVLAEKMSKINALSGTGKTSELVFISESLIEPSLYLAFNKSMALEAKGKFPDHVECMTTHSLAYRNVGKGYQHKLKRPTGRYVNVAGTGNEIAKYFRLPEFEITELKTITKSFLGLIIKETVGKFEISAEEGITGESVPYHHIKDLESRYGKAFDKKSFIKLIVRYANKLWNERTDKYSEVLCTHNTYLKLYQLKKPKLSNFSVIYIDEAQDLNAVTLDIILGQKDHCKLIFVGDKFQQLYAWNGSINTMQNLDCKAAKLSKSFRFGTELAKVASYILGENLEGNEEVDTKVGFEDSVIDFDKPYTILFRTNMEQIFKAVEMISKGEDVSVNIDLKDFVAILRSAGALYNNELKKVKHENIIPFSTWEDLVEEGKEDRELGRITSIVEDGGGDKMINTLHSHHNSTSAKITLTTAHKAKGLEYDQVLIAEDFPSNYNSKGEFKGITDEERNIIYVAITRARFSVKYNELVQEFIDIQEDRDVTLKDSYEYVEKNLTNRQLRSRLGNMTTDKDSAEYLYICNKYGYDLSEMKGRNDYFKQRAADDLLTIDEHSEWGGISPWYDPDNDLWSCESEDDAVGRRKIYETKGGD